MPLPEDNTGIFEAVRHDRPKSSLRAGTIPLFLRVVLFLVVTGFGVTDGMALVEKTQGHRGDANDDEKPISVDSDNLTTQLSTLQTVNEVPIMSSVFNTPKESRAAMEVPVVPYTTDTNPEPNCGECWCIPDTAANETCPSFSPGLFESYPTSWITALKSFQRADTALTLQPEGCFPFDVQLDTTRYPEANNPTCDRPSGVTDDTVCAFLFPGADGEVCTGRSYSVQTFASTTEAQAAGALVIHRGPCGVCSNAQDLAVRAETLDTMNPISVLCAATYVVDSDRENRFENLVDCYKTNTGFTDPCARLWAFFGQANAALCPDFCPVALGNDIELNQPAPDCGLSACLACSADSFEDDFNQLAGLWKSPYNAGFYDPVAYPCGFFYRLEEDFDPCVGAVLGDVTATQPPSSGAFVLGCPEFFALLAIVLVWVM
jgi:hypothetical protein